MAVHSLVPPLGTRRQRTPPKQTAVTVRCWPACVLDAGGLVACGAVDGRATAACSIAVLGRPVRRHAQPSPAQPRLGDAHAHADADADADADAE